MYRHLLVPLDGSTLDTDLVRQSVLLAKALGARITFFHAQEDYGASSVGAIERVMWPTLQDDHDTGVARAVLAKATVVAREAGIEHETLVFTSNRPHEAILQAAQARGCDLVVIVSHGRRGLRGLVFGSQTQGVLQQASLPVLVLAAAGNIPDWARVEALAILRDRLRSLAAVVHGLEVLSGEVRTQGRPPPFDLLRAIVRYIRAYPDALLHPTEEAYLFRKLRERTAEVNDTLDLLQKQHAEGLALIDDLERSVVAYEADTGTGYEPFAEAVRRFAAAQKERMRLESGVVLPAASTHLTVDDWSGIGKAFAANNDPRFGADSDEEFRLLFVRILSLVPDRGAADAERP